MMRTVGSRAEHSLFLVVKENKSNGIAVFFGDGAHQIQQGGHAGSVIVGGVFVGRSAKQESQQTKIGQFFDHQGHKPIHIQRSQQQAKEKRTTEHND